MKLIFKILIGIIVVAAIAGYAYWQMNKKGIIKNAIENTVEKKTEDLYFIHYDSSQIDELNGNAVFYKVRLQSDSAQKEILKSTDSLPNALYFVSVDKVSASGVDMVGMLQKNIAARSIILDKPVIQIINTGEDKPTPFTYRDTLELYQKILGKFNSIHAGTIQVVDGTVLITDKKGKALTTLEKINITLNNFLVDSTRNYEHIISYFIKDVKVTVENIQLPEAKNGTRINVSQLLYDARGKILHIDAIQQYRKGNTTPVVDVKNVQVNNLDTDAFIVKQQLKAGLVSCDGGLVTIYKKKKKKQSGGETVELSNDLIDEAKIGGIRLNKTKIILIDPLKPNEPPFIINDVTFSAIGIAGSTEGNTLNELVSNAEWELSAGKFSLVTRDKLYEFSAADMRVNNKNGTVKVKQVLLQPLVTEAAFMRRSAFQKDRYDLKFTNIHLSGVNFKKLIGDNILEMERASLQPLLKIFNDRTLKPGLESKVGKYPHQSLVKMPFKIYIKKIVVNNGAVFYKEKAKKSELQGEPNFTRINGVLSNVTNIPERIQADSKLRLKARSLFLGTANVTTEWVLPLGTSDSTFTVTGQIGPMDAAVLNQVTEPLAMLSVKTGEIKKLVFVLKGGNYKGDGTATLLYNDLTVTVLKMSDDELKKKGLGTFFANTLIKNNNPRNNKTHTGTIDFKRDTQKSFFNFLWKSVFDGVKKIVL